ncbi:hypothetical protein NRB56_27870 [Nocardia sp. RB56]|uniref:Uncharacterized protein n=1 Tax=Nocardia aurantia TaxID=2585199 RepID=A0A7K0DN83_9NOCA|nr:hypothetical protein [Nocardia aurantia]
MFAFGESDAKYKLSDSGIGQLLPDRYWSPNDSRAQCGTSAPYSG